MKPSIAVIGAGLGGMACAARLAKEGFAVTLFEKNQTVGGKMQTLKVDGFTWDMGPSLLTMPDVLEELWTTLGARLEDDLDLVKLATTCRYRWIDGTVIDENAAFWEQPEVARFLKYAGGLFEISSEAFLHHRLEDWWKQLQFRNLGKLRHFPKIASSRTMHETVMRFFKNPHLVQLFDRFATYNGSSPWKTPAAFNIIPYVQQRFGGWYVRGGMVRIAEKLRERAEQCGVRFRMETEVGPLVRAGEKWLVNGVAFDRVVCNEDLLTAHETILPEARKNAFRRSHLEKLDVSMSGFILFLGIGKRFPKLEHHNIFFSPDYQKEFSELEAGKPAAWPTIYVAVNNRSDPGNAPEGCENWFVLINMPAGSEAPPGYGDRVLEILETQFAFEGLRDSILVRKEFTPQDFANRDNSWKGALYGFASHGAMTAFRRPSMEMRDLPGVHFVGGTTHPGGGIPLVLLSGKITSDRIAALAR